jgi:hypothetical protein
MVSADSATVEWNSSRKRWEVHILVGAEVIKRPIEQRLADMDETAIKDLACKTARDEGYDLSPDHVAVGTHAQ